MWLQAGIMDADSFQKSAAVAEPAPQGGVISPLLTNIALDGMERKVKQIAAE